MAATRCRRCTASGASSGALVVGTLSPPGLEHGLISFQQAARQGSKSVTTASSVGSTRAQDCQALDGGEATMVGDGDVVKETIPSRLHYAWITDGREDVGQ